MYVIWGIVYVWASINIVQTYSTVITFINASSFLLFDAIRPKSNGSHFEYLGTLIVLGAVGLIVYNPAFSGVADKVNLVVNAVILLSNVEGAFFC